MKNLVLVVFGVIACFGIAVADGDKKDDATIVKEASVALDENPNDLAARVVRSDAALNSKNYDMAIEDFTILIDKAPTSSAYFKRAQAYIGKGDDDKAIEDFSASLKLDDKSLYAYYFRGGLYTKKGEFRKAIADFDETIALSSDNIYFFYSRGDAYYQLGDYESAIRDWKKAIAIGYDKKILQKRIAEARAKMQ